MTKYEELYAAYKSTIDRIKTLRQKASCAHRQARELTYLHDIWDLLLDNREADRQKLADLYTEAAVADQEAQDLLEEVKYGVDREYELVPFPLRRQQGIAGFWRLADL